MSSRRRFNRMWVGPLMAMLVGAFVLSSGCSGESAEQMMQTAEFEELQRNHEHARQLYQRVVEKFPDSAEAKKAAERLAALAEAE